MSLKPLLSGIKEALQRIYNNLKLSAYFFLKNFLVPKDIIINMYYDYKLGIETFGLHKKCGSKTFFNDGIYYSPANYSLLKNMCKHLRILSSDVIVDFGCGKGRVVLYMATLKLKKVIGVECDKSLVEIARQNLRNLKYKKTNVEIIHKDAVHYDVKEGNIFFFFNPFGCKTRDAVLNNIKNSYKKNPRKITIIYAFPGPSGRVLLKQEKWLRLSKSIGLNANIWISKPLNRNKEE